MSLNRKKGFTVTELMISMTIMTVILVVVVFKGKDLSSNIALSDAIQQVSLSLREAQAYGISVKEDTANPGQFTNAYGVTFDTGANTSSFIFSDRDANGFYDGGGSCVGECVQKIDLSNNITISAICVSPNSGSGCVSMTKAHISFLRPNPEPVIRATNNGGNNMSGVTYYSATITLRNNLGRTRSVVIDNVGKIDIQ
jgi:prepilin-type N-terminal cleavage/methylation domain-containing protein